jgi:multidrug efflux pump subunit AcrB
MRAPGLVGTIQLAAAVVFALPLAILGVQMALAGRTLGFAFLVLAGLMLLLPHVLTNPLDPVDVAERATSRVTGDDEE